MEMPAFTACASLGKSRRKYHGRYDFAGGAAPGVVPSQETETGSEQDYGEDVESDSGMNEEDENGEAGFEDDDSNSFGTETEEG